MAALSLDGSPTPRKKLSIASGYRIHDDTDVENTDPARAPMSGTLKRDNSFTQVDRSAALSTSRLVNQVPLSMVTRNTTFKKTETGISGINPSPIVPVVPRQLVPIASPMEHLLARLSEQQALLSKQKDEVGAQQNFNDSCSSHSESVRPYAEHYATTPATGSNRASDSPEDVEVLRLKRELEMAQNRISRMDQEISQSRITKHTLEQALGSQFDPDFDHTRDLRPQSSVSRIDSWVQSTEPGPPPMVSQAQALPSGRGIWNPASALNANTSGPGIIGQGPPVPPPVPNGGWPFTDPRSFTGPPVNTNFFASGPSGRRTPLRMDTNANTYFGDATPADMAMRGGIQSSRPPSALGHLPPWTNFNVPDGLTPPLTPFQDMQQHTMPPMPGMQGMPHMQQTQQLQQMHETGMMQNEMRSYLPKNMGTRLSPMAVEFQAGGFGGPSSYHVSLPHGQSTGAREANSLRANTETPGSYISNSEPMNYRRLLDRNMSCNWKYIVDKIVHSNDQQASIFLQQKLKISTQEQKFEIVQAIIDQAYPLMVNRFGNFLVQRCFEHGTPEQVIAIARAIRGNTLNLSMDAFGCHVVQKAFDCVPEEYKAIMVHELLRRIPETVIHRYACHVWQKLFELRWSDSPPQIMKYVNEALRGMWHEVALGETGSLVVQNIFENCLEEDKRPCINEVLASIDVVAHGQFGNWCIQHICEHGAPPDRNRAIDHVLRFATEYSMDQFASKVVEKCLKIGGPDFLDRYLDKVCEARSDRPRMPLIDISGDQFGNYLVQYILTHADPQRREIVAAHIRKHMVSLRGSKYGSRVAMLCCNPAVATRPGPPVGLPLNRGYSERSFGGSNRSYGYSSSNYR